MSYASVDANIDCRGPNLKMNHLSDKAILNEPSSAFNFHD